jgi:RNA polymerase sigma-70 factor (ECF subfamily)
MQKKKTRKRRTGPEFPEPSKQKAAYANLVKPRLKLIRTIVGRYRWAVHDPEEAVQEIALRIIRYSKRADPDRNVDSWVSRIADNFCKGLARAEKARRTKQFLENLEGKEYSTEDLIVLDRRTGIRQKEPPESLTEREEIQGRLRRVMGALKQLTPMERGMIMLQYGLGKHVKEHSEKELAEIFEIPVGTVKSRLNRIREKLKKML